MQLITVRNAPAILAFLLATALSGATQAAPEIVEACKACHAEDGAGVGKANVPIIAGMPAVHIEEALYAYKDGARQCLEEPVMCDTADLLSDENIADLAEHYGALPRGSVDEQFDSELAAIGEKVHRKLCARLPPAARRCGCRRRVGATAARAAVRVPALCACGTT